ncbi:MAG: hypothetical protein AB1649_26145 [Chloroflexota bacterium]
MSEQQSRGNLFSALGRIARWKVWILAIFLILIVVIGGLYAGTSVWPSVGSQGAQVLRQIFGNPFVAELEMFVFAVQDAIQNWKYASGLAEPSAPWKAPAGQAVSFDRTPTPGAGEIVLTPNVQKSITQENPSASTSSLSPTAEITPGPRSSPAATVMPSSEPLVWPPQPLKPLGSIEGEGVWSAYIEDDTHRTVAYRAYLQPDPHRPYAVVAVIAFDLTHANLNFVLGSIEPISEVELERPGEIPAGDRVPGKLLATFNGGFQAQHGHFGAVFDGMTAIPPQDGLGTVVISESGEIFIGKWGEDLADSSDLRALRQNGPLVVHNGELTPQVFSFSPKDWGYTINEVSPTWRSGLALDASRRVLFYICGPSLTVEALGNSMVAAGARNGLQLDINRYWVLFTTFESDGGNLIPKPLFPDTMNENIARYLHPYTHDFFYITAKDW